MVLSEALSVRLEIEADLDARRHLDVLVDDASAQLGVPADTNALVEDALLDLGERVHAAADAEHAAVDAATPMIAPPAPSVTN